MPPEKLGMRGGCAQIEESKGGVSLLRPAGITQAEYNRMLYEMQQQ